MPLYVGLRWEAQRVNRHWPRIKTQTWYLNLTNASFLTFWASIVVWLPPTASPAPGHTDSLTTPGPGLHPAPGLNLFSDSSLLPDPTLLADYTWLPNHKLFVATPYSLSMICFLPIYLPMTASRMLATHCFLTTQPATSYRLAVSCSLTIP